VPKFTCEVTFDLSTSIEFDGNVQYALDTNEVEDFEDNSYFYGNDIENDGGSVTFVVEAADEDEAEAAASDVVTDGNEIEDSSGITWLITNVSISVEKVEEPMTLERARALLVMLADDVSEEQQEAIRFVLDHIASLSAKVAAIEAQLAEAQRSLAEVKASMPTSPEVVGTYGQPAAFDPTA
jgi:hypothetical protein